MPAWKRSPSRSASFFPLAWLLPKCVASGFSRKAHELRGLLESAIDNLPNGMREVFVLREVEGLNTLEVAECLGVSEDVVKTRLSRGRALLRTLLIERTGAAAPEAFRFYRPRCDRVVARVLATICGRSSSA